MLISLRCRGICVTRIFVRQQWLPIGLRRYPEEALQMGKHDDYNTQEGTPFGIPVLYSTEKVSHIRTFVNGDVGKPWLVSIMLYATDEKFLPEYGMGTVFCKKNGEVVSRADCRHTVNDIPFKQYHPRMSTIRSGDHFSVFFAKDSSHSILRKELLIRGIQHNRH